MDKRTIAIVATLGIALLTLVVIVADHMREPVFMEDPPKWGPGPILVAYEPGLADHARDIHEAIQQINREADCPIFSMTTPGNAKAILKWLDTDACGLGERSKPLGKDHVEGMWNCRNGTVEVQFADLADPRLRYPIIVHALGHVAGLAHDTSGPSVMRDPPPPMGAPAPGLTMKDADALAQKFCP